MKNGASEPISAALATLLCVAPAKKIGEVEAEEDARYQRLAHVPQGDPPASAPAGRRSRRR